MPGREERERLAQAFFGAARSGDMQTLVSMLAEDVEFVGDGGASKRGISQPVHGRVPVARLVKGLTSLVLHHGVHLEPTSIGTQPAVVLLDPEDRLVGVWTLVLGPAGEVRAVHGMVNPAKLGHLGIALNTQGRAAVHSKA